jgi:hypothetical protein
MAALRDAPKATNVAELRSWIGLMTFYTKFIPNQATIMAPLCALLQSRAAWEWSAVHNQAFDQAKSVLMNSTALVHFDTSCPVVVSCDASPVGVGAVLANVIDGVECPVMFISRSLTPAERAYSQLEREGLSVIFAVSRLRQFLLGRPFVIYTDHKPLLSLFSPDKRLPPVAAARILRWSLVLAGYQYVLKYRPGPENGNADAMSLPLSSFAASADECPQDIVLFVEQNDPPCTAAEMRSASERDPIISSVIQVLRSGRWPTPLPGTLVAYYKKGMS